MRRNYPKIWVRLAMYLVLTCIIPGPLCATTTIINNYNFTGSAKNTGVAFHFNNMPDYTLSQLGKTIYLTFKQAKWRAGSTQNFTNQDIHAFNIFPQDDGRLIVELKVAQDDVEAEVQLGQASDGPGYLFEVNLMKADATSSKKIEQAVNKAKLLPKKTSQPVIVLDPGHGGHDPGAVSKYKKLCEKNITLTYAKQLKQHLEETFGYKVVLTRNKDKYLTLRQRIKIAQKHNADLFVSMHADSHPNKKASGLSVYTLSDKASDAEAAWLASRHDLSDAVKEVKDLDNSRDVNQMLVGMMNRDNRNSSAEFANLLVKKLSSKARLLQNRHRFARFMVLKQLSSPAVLVELGYLSNRHDAKLLASSSYRNKLVTAIGEAIHQHLLHRKIV